MQPKMVSKRGAGTLIVEVKPLILGRSGPVEWGVGKRMIENRCCSHEEQVSRIHWRINFIILSSKPPIFLTKPFEQLKPENVHSNKDFWKNLYFGNESLCSANWLPYCVG